MKNVLFFFAAALFAVAAQAGEYADVTISELKELIAAKKVTVIDVNGTKSYENKGRVPTAIDYAKHKGNLAQVLPADKNALVVAYCGSPSCGAYKAAAKEAKELGYTNVKHLSAGISGWMAAGEKVEGGKPMAMAN